MLRDNVVDRVLYKKFHLGLCLDKTVNDLGQQSLKEQLKSKNKV